MKFVLKILLACTLPAVYSQGIAQTRVSLSTDFSVLRSLKEGQRYWSVGQTVSGHFHLTPRNGAYAWISYYTKGSFDNELLAVARTGFPLLTPYTNRAKMSFKHISLGWRHYLIGSSNSEEGVNIYGFAGLGLMLGLVENTHSVQLDTAQYRLPVLSGRQNFKRLTVDLGAGVEFPVGADIFIYGEGKTYVPVSWYPSPYILDSKYAPQTVCFNLGVRILLN